MTGPTAPQTAVEAPTTEAGRRLLMLLPGETLGWYGVRGAILAIEAEARAAIRAESSAETERLPDESWCDCDREPIYGIRADRHLPSCRYGIVMDYLDIRDPRALAPADAAGGREAHTHGPLTWNGGRKQDGGGWKCDACGAFPVEIGA